MTSPPYFDTERYNTQNPEGQVWRTYSSKAAFFDGFLKPMFRNFWNRLDTNGIWCLNVPTHYLEHLSDFHPYIIKQVLYNTNSQAVYGNKAKESICFFQKKEPLSTYELPPHSANPEPHDVVEERRAKRPRLSDNTARFFSTPDARDARIKALETTVSQQQQRIRQQQARIKQLTQTLALLEQPPENSSSNPAGAYAG